MNLSKSEIRQEVNKQLGKTYFWYFCLYYDYDFFKKRPFLKKAAEAMQRVAEGKSRKISISMPPRAGKSYLTSLFCAWMLQLKPHDSVMRNSCTARLYNKLSYDVRDVVKSDLYKKAFPKIELAKDSSAVTGWKINSSKQMGYFGGGVGGTIIGFGASSVAITDDLYRGIEDALSETYNDKVHRWKESSHDSRLEKNCPEIDIGTRWTKTDIIGKAMEFDRYDEVIVIPALNENGESFCEDVKTTEEYLRTKEEIDKTVWLAEYMQKPIEAEGLLFPSSELNYYEYLNEDNIEGCFGYCDVADEGEDFLAFVCGKVDSSGNIFINDILFTREGVEVTHGLSLDLMNRNKMEIARIESNNQGGIFANNLMKETDTEILKSRSTSNKHTRILMASGMIKNQVFFKKNYDIGSDYDKFMNNLTQYLRAGGNKHDDAPDALSGLTKFIKQYLPHLYELT